VCKNKCAVRCSAQRANGQAVAARIARILAACKNRERGHNTCPGSAYTRSHGVTRPTIKPDLKVSRAACPVIHHGSNHAEQTRDRHRASPTPSLFLSLSLSVSNVVAEWRATNNVVIFARSCPERKRLLSITGISRLRRINLINRPRRCYGRFTLSPRNRAFAGAKAHTRFPPRADYGLTPVRFLHLISHK